MKIFAGEVVRKGERLNLYLVGGRLYEDATEVFRNGATYGKATIVVGNDENGEPEYLSVDGWYNRGHVIGSTKKFDYIVAIGPIEDVEMDGKVYHNMRADYVGIESNNGAEKVQRALEEMRFEVEKMKIYIQRTEEEVERAKKFLNEVMKKANIASNLVMPKGGPVPKEYDREMTERDVEETNFLDKDLVI